MAAPSRSEIDEFVRANDIDERAAADLRDCPPDVQRKVLARGELSSARNPSAALLARIRDARVSASSGGSTGGGGRSNPDVEEFIRNNGVDESAADSLRSSSAAVQQAVLARGELKTARNPSSALLARIRDANMGVPGGAFGSMGGMSGTSGMAPGAGAGSYPPTQSYGPPPSGYGAMWGAGAGPSQAPPGYGGYGMYGGMYPQYPPSGFSSAPSGYGSAPGAYGGYGHPGAYGGYGGGSGGFSNGPPAGPMPGAYGGYGAPGAGGFGPPPAGPMPSSRPSGRRRSRSRSSSRSRTRTRSRGDRRRRGRD